MKSQLTNLLNAISNSTFTQAKVSGVNASNNGQQKKTFTAAELWNIQRRKRTKNLSCIQLGW